MQIWLSVKLNKDVRLHFEVTDVHVNASLIGNSCKNRDLGSNIPILFHFIVTGIIHGRDNSEIKFDTACYSNCAGDSCNYL